MTKSAAALGRISPRRLSFLHPSQGLLRVHALATFGLGDRSIDLLPYFTFVKQQALGLRVLRFQCLPKNLLDVLKYAAFQPLLDQRLQFRFQGDRHACIVTQQ